MKTTITRNQCRRTNTKILFSKTLGEIEDYYREGRINQSEFELYKHFWDKTHNRSCPCYCAYCLVEQGESEKLYQWLSELNYNDCFDFFCSFGWPEGHSYCMGNKEYYDYTGFPGMQKNLQIMFDELIENNFYRSKK